jgi:hypothetical protein
MSIGMCLCSVLRRAHIAIQEGPYADVTVIGRAPVILNRVTDGRITKERRDCFRAIESDTSSEGSPSLRDREHLRDRQSGTCHDGVKKDLVGSGLVPLTVIAGYVHAVLGMFSDEGPLFITRQPTVPKPVIKVLIWSKFPRGSAQTDNFPQDAGHLPATAERKAQVVANVGDRDTVQL